MICHGYGLAAIVLGGGVRPCLAILTFLLYVPANFASDHIRPGRLYGLYVSPMQNIVQAPTGDDLRLMRLRLRLRQADVAAEWDHRGDGRVCRAAGASSPATRRRIRRRSRSVRDSQPYAGPGPILEAVGSLSEAVAGFVLADVAESHR